MKRNFALLCAALALLFVFAGCAHPWRLAQNPNPVEQTALPVTTEEPAESPAGTELPETESPDTEEPVADTEVPETEVPGTEVPVETETAAATDEPSSEPSFTPAASTDTPAPSDSSVSQAPTASPTAAPTETPKPTSTPTPTPTPTPAPTPKPADIPPFCAQTINGYDLITNSVFSAQNVRVTMVNVWATTCEPCKQEMPHIQQLANNYASRGLQVLSVLADSETPGCINKALEFMNSINFTLPVLRYKADVAAAFPAGAYPMTYFIDTNGNILRVESTSHTYDQWVSIVNGLLG